MKDVHFSADEIKTLQFLCVEKIMDYERLIAESIPYVCSDAEKKNLAFFQEWAEELKRIYEMLSKSVM